MERGEVQRNLDLLMQYIYDAKLHVFQVSAKFCFSLVGTVYDDVVAWLKCNTCNAKCMVVARKLLLPSKRLRRE